MCIDFWEVSWCSWLSHHFHVVRVPGSNPGGTIFVLVLFCSFFYYHTYCFFCWLLKKQRREVSINRPASYEPAALPLRHPAYLPFFILPLLFLVRSSFIPYFLFPKKVPLPGIEPGAQTWEACMLPTTPQWTYTLSPFILRVFLLPHFSLFIMYSF